MPERFQVHRTLSVLTLVLALTAGFDADAFQPDDFTPNVVDATGTLTPSQVAALNGHIQLLRDRADVQAAIYLVDSTGDASIEEAAETTFERWRLGEAGRDNGVLLLFALEDRRARIETGYGLEGSITDLHARRVLDDVILPRFKSGQYFEGLSAGLYALGYVKTQDEFFLSPGAGIELSAAELSGDDASGDFDVARGFRYWGIFAALLWMVPAVFRMARALVNARSVPRKRRVRYLLHLDGAWFVKLFLTVNPGVFIFLSPLFIGPIWDDLQPLLAKVDLQAALSRWLGWVALLFALPALLRLGAWAIGRQRENPNPVFRQSWPKTLAFVLTGDGFAPMVGKGVLAVMPGIFVAAAPYLGDGLRMMLLVSGTLAAVIWLVVTWRGTLAPLVSSRAYRRKQARARLYRIQNRVKQSRPIFGKLYTYTPPQSSSGSSSGWSSSSSSGSSFSSSSGGGRSGGGGASSGW